MSRIRVLLADPQRMVAEAFAALIKDSFDVVGTVQNGRVLVEEATRLGVDVIVTAIFLPLLNGIDAARQLKEQGVEAKLVFLTTHADAKLAAEAFRAGAAGYVTKDGSGEELIDAIRAAVQGQAYVTSQIAKEMIGVLLEADRNSAGIGMKPQLTLRQREVLQLVAEGRTMKEIAEILSISTRRAEAHKYDTMGILGVQTIAGLVQWAIRLRLVSIE